MFNQNLINTVANSIYSCIVTRLNLQPGLQRYRARLNKFRIMRQLSAIVGEENLRIEENQILAIHQQILRTIQQQQPDILPFLRLTIHYSPEFADYIITVEYQQ